MRKTSKYARKARISGATYNGAAFINTIAACRAYSEDPIIPGVDSMQTQTAATKNALVLREEFEALKTGSGNLLRAYDIVANALDVGRIRAIEIAGCDVEQNSMLPIFYAADAAIRRASDRYNRTQRMGLDGPAITEIADALDVYDEILRNSSPLQMTKAEDVRFAIISAQKTKRERMAA